MSYREKNGFTFDQDDTKLTLDFIHPIDYVMVDFNPESAFISLTYEDKPYDEMITLRFNQPIDTKASSYVHDKTGDKKLHLSIAKQVVEGEAPKELKFSNDYKFVEKRNHPKADPRGYQVKKPEKKNWDKIVATLDDSDEGEGDANGALKKIYDQCDDDTKRAMEKSLYESHGTVLNMNWGEVGKGKVKPYESSDADNFKGFDRHDRD